MERLGLYPAHLDRTCIDYSLLVCQSLGNSVFGDNSLPGRCMRRDKDTLVTLDGVDGDLLEGVQGELVFPCGLFWRNMVRDRYIRVTGWYRDLVADLWMGSERDPG